MATPSNYSTPKQQRATRACDFCHRRGRRCRIQPNQSSSPQCITCVSHGVACTWHRAVAKRGVKPRYLDSADPRWAFNENKHGSWSLIELLIGTFFDSVYPVSVAITVHEQTFRDQWAAKNIPHGRASYARLMAMCALSAHRIKSGASLTPRKVPDNFDPKLYLGEALLAIPENLGDIRDFQALQAISLVCLAALHSNNVPVLHKYLGLYHAALAEQGFCDEKRWPRDISTIEKEERRRLFWHMYRLEVHTSLVMGHVVRCPELHSSVTYPTIPDNDPTDSDVDTEWLSGWNFITDLYRGIEHGIAHFKSRRGSSNINNEHRNLSTSFILDYDPQEKILGPLARARRNLPDRFKSASKVSSNVRRNRCGFQAANIACTYQLLRMVSFSADHTTLHEACQTVLELIEEISAIPIDYLRAMSLAMLQELSGFGHILSGFIRKDLSKPDYQHLRTVMICMSELLESLASSMASAMEASERLRTYVEEIDRFLGMPQISSKTSNAHFSQTSEDRELYIQHKHHDAGIVPLDILQRIPWPAEWVESVGFF